MAFEVDALVVRFSLTFFCVLEAGTFLLTLVFFTSAVVFLPLATGGFAVTSDFLLATVVDGGGLVSGLVDLDLEDDVGRDDGSRDFVVLRVVLDTVWCFAASRADERGGAAVLQLVAFLVLVTSELDLDVPTAAVFLEAGRDFEMGDFRIVT